ncbi:hypothetical protein HEB94_007267 [Actinopolymorpha pittospori]|uniref:Uncharacterized protein n=1 Tax=Actinopolymorpha pittospori TaxID=648752 RepID=A0A927N1I9_9ACTN|nr:hypothetical protein [Actinopolymorpha pittospori]
MGAEPADPREPHRHRAAVRRDPVAEPHRSPQSGEHEERPVGASARGRIQGREVQRVVQHAGVEPAGRQRRRVPQPGVVFHLGGLTLAQAEHRPGVRAVGPRTQVDECVENPCAGGIQLRK